MDGSQSELRLSHHYSRDFLSLDPDPFALYNFLIPLKRNLEEILAKSPVKKPYSILDKGAPSGCQL
jgi:hypothetical protein